MARQEIPDLYAVLGVSPDATEEEITRAYRRLAREHHPDVNDDPTAEQRFKEIAAAYETLSDPAKRRQYDRFGAGGVSLGDPFPFGDLTDLFDAFFGGGFRRPRGPRTRARRGEDLGVQVDLSFEEAAFGVEKEVAVQSRERCPRCTGTGCEPGTHPSRCSRCGGAGEIQDVARSVFGTVMTARPCPRCEGTGREIATPCADCGGEGRIPKRERVTVEIPAGVADGTELRVGGAGAAGRNEGPPGDLFVTVRLRPHAVFERRGQDLVAALRITFTQAALGADLDVSTLDGTEKVRIDPGTEPGTVIRLRGRGVPNLAGRGRGDLYLTVQVEIPKGLLKRERELLHELAAIRGEEPEVRGKRRTGLLGRLIGP
ncbi:MAG TPA: molecular chaperone DnaJ [Actinomycetota bacterium]|nr:molecular chaperone DnaJ [Actinomycetota bacterium]